MLIDKTEIGRYREVSRSVRDDKINPYIDDAETLDLRPLLGDELYYDLVSNVNDIKYQDILNPKEYVYNGTTYRHVGLKKVLSLFSYARYVLFGSFTDTSFGFVQKSNQDSQPVGNEFKRNIYTQDRQTAVRYFNDIAMFLNRNSKDYPLWKRDCHAVNRGIRISKITK